MTDYTDDYTTWDDGIEDEVTSFTKHLRDDPLKFISVVWPDVRIYDKQAEIIQSVWENDITIVIAGNMLGKDFITALLCLTFFCTRSPARVVTSSVDGEQLDSVLWGEIRRLLSQADFRLPIRENHLHLRQETPDGELVPLGEMVGRVAKKGEGMLGRHIARTDERPRTLMAIDESSGFEDQHFETASTWAHRILAIGNPYECENFFRQADRDGSIKRKNGKGFYQKVIRITAEDSPNVRAKKVVIPGCIDWDTYQTRRERWDPIRQTVSLDAQFYEGEEVKLYPPKWLSMSNAVAEGGERQGAKHLGCDPAEGGDDTVWTVIDDIGIVHQVEKKTVDTTVITEKTIQLIKQYSIRPENVMFDRGGGGKQIADQLRKQGYNVSTTGFGERPTDPFKGELGITEEQRRDSDEIKMVYKNRRAEMYGMLRKMIDPGEGPVFGIPLHMDELLRQLKPLPLLYDGEGVMFLPPKRDKAKKKDTGLLKDLQTLLGRSPDHADSLVLACFSRERELEIFTVG